MRSVHNLYSSPDTIWMIKSSRMRWARCANPKGRDHTWETKRQMDIKMDLEEIWHTVWNELGRQTQWCPMVGSCDQGNELSDFLTGANFLTTWVSARHKQLWPMELTCTSTRQAFCKEQSFEYSDETRLHFLQEQNTVQANLLTKCFKLRSLSFREFYSIEWTWDSFETQFQLWNSGYMQIMEILSVIS
jgi:hypothetical protein